MTAPRKRWKATNKGQIEVGSRVMFRPDMRYDATRSRKGEVISLVTEGVTYAHVYWDGEEEPHKVAISWLVLA
jgi:hypothetical protein